MEDLVQTAKQTISKSEQKIEEIAKQNIQAKNEKKKQEDQIKSM